jgi:hypothetical protein
MNPFSCTHISKAWGFAGNHIRFGSYGRPLHHPQETAPLGRIYPQWREHPLPQPGDDRLLQPHPQIYETSS